MNSLDAALARVNAQLGRFRRRLILVTFFRVLPIALASALAAAVLFQQIPAALSVCGALVAAAVIAYRRTGGVGQVAATLDRRFGLANRLATALAFATHDDGMTSLIAADADLALSRRRPEDIAFETPRHFTWIVIGAAALVVAAVVVRQSSSETEVSVASHGVLGADAAASPSAGRRALASTPSPASVSEAAPRPAASAGDRRATTPSDSSKPASATDTGSRQTKPAESAAETAARVGEPNRNPASTARASAEPNDAPAAGRAGREQSAKGGASPSQPRSARGDLGGGVGANARRSSTTRAGGVRGTGAEPSNTSDREPPALANRTATAPLAAWDRAESAIEREHLPLELRAYVRDYLVAIKSGGLP